MIYQILILSADVRTIRNTLRAVKKHAPPNNELPKHLNNLKCAPLNKINFQSA